MSKYFSFYIAKRLLGYGALTYTAVFVISLVSLRYTYGLAGNIDNNLASSKIHTVQIIAKLNIGLTVMAYAMLTLGFVVLIIACLRSVRLKHSKHLKHHKL